MIYHAQNVPVVHPVRVAPAPKYASLPTLPMTHEGGGLYSLRGETTQAWTPSPDNPAPLASTYRAGSYLLDLADVKWLLTLDDDLRSAGDAADILYVDRYSRRAWVRKNVQSLRLDGRLNYMHEMDYTSCARFTLVCATYGVAVNNQNWGHNIICDRLITSQPDTANPNREYMIVNGWSKTVLISIQKNRMDGYDDSLPYAQKVQAIKAHFNANPAEAYCQFAVPAKSPQSIVELDLWEETATVALSKTVNAKLERLVIEGDGFSGDLAVP